LLLVDGIGRISGEFSGRLVLGIFFACPTAGLFIGGALDRIYAAVSLVPRSM
jgi:uncharacterized membrane protein